VAIDLRDVAAPPRELASGSSTITSVAFQPHGSLLAAASFDGSVRLWNVDDAKPAPAVLRAPDGQRVHALAFSSDGTMLAVAQASGGVARYDVARPADQPRVACSGVQVRSVAFRPKGDLVACGSREGFVILDDGRTPSRRLVGHASTVNAIQFDPAGNLLASASSDGTVRIWDTTLADPQAVVLPGHTSWVWSLGFTPNGERIISGAQDKTMRIWPARASILAADLCRAAAGTLTEAQWEKWMPSDVAFRASPCVAR
jgi:WD40 repeat protein